MDNRYFLRVFNKSGKLSKLISEVYPELPYNFLMKLIRKKDVKVNGKTANQDLTVNRGDSVSLYLMPNAVPLEIVFNNAYVFCVNKPKSLVSDGKYSLESLANYIYPNSKMLHRLDTNTEGLVLFAKNNEVYEYLREAMRNEQIEKTYSATVYGEFSFKNSLIDGYLLKDNEKGRVKIYDNQVKGSVYVSIIANTISQKDGLSVLSVTLHNGKTHQIRALLAHFGCFIIGDSKYGDDRINKMYGYKSQELKAVALKFDFAYDPYNLGGMVIKSK